MEPHAGNKTYKLLWELIKYRPWYYLLDTMIWIVVFVIPLVPGLITKEFFDMLSESSSSSLTIWGIIALTALTAFIHITFMHLGARVDTVHRFMMSGLVRRNILWNILHKPGAMPLPGSTGEVINSIRDDANQVEESITWTIDMIGTAIFSFVAIFILFRIDAQMTLLIFTPLVVVTVLTQRASEKIKQIRERSREATSDVIGATGEMLRSVQAIKLAGAEVNFANHIHGLNQKRHHLMVKDSLWNQLVYSINSTTISIGTGLILLLSGQSMKSGGLSVGDFVLFLSYLHYVTNFTHEFGSFLAHYKQTGVSFGRMLKLRLHDKACSIVEHHPLILSRESAPEKSISQKRNELQSVKVEGITYKHPSSSRGIEDIHFTIHKGEFVVITGRVGAGKSTLVKAILGLLEPQSGMVYWNDQRIEDPSSFFEPPFTAYTPQMPSLFSDTIRRNILLGLPEKESNLEQAVYQAALDKDIHMMDKGLDTVIGPRGVKLSGGQQQRVAAARMFVRNPELLVFDDISSALDVETEMKLWERLIEGGKPTSLVVSNRRAALQRADQIIVMKDGRVAAKGSFHDLMDNCEELQQIWGM